MELIPLGTAAGGVPRPGDAGSGYLIRDGDTRILLDIGGGVLGNLIRHVPYADVDALFISHLHFDHCLDIFPLLLVRAARKKLPVYGPPMTEKILGSFFPLFTAKPQLYAGAMEVREYAAREVYEVGTVSVTPVQVSHDIPSYALRVSGGGTVAYSSDTAVCEGLVQAAKDADVLLSEATLQAGMEDAAGRESHMDSVEAGKMARQAGAKRLLLTHIRYDLDPEVSIGEASEAFGGPVEAAEVNKVYRT